MDKYARVALVMVIFVFGYFFYRGVTTEAWEGDSLAYHIPIAQNIASGKFTNFPSLLEYYPASSETILAGFMLLGLPLNTFNLLAWVLLFFLGRKLATMSGTTKDLATICAAAICLLPSVIRLIPTQTADLWLAVFFLWALMLLLKPEKSLAYLIKVGIALGMLVGSKYSGPLFAVPLLVLYGRPLLKSKLSYLVAGGLAFTITGLGWYIRNWYFMGNPFYPTGAEGFRLLNWQLWKTLVMPGGIWLAAQALISEYLIWAAAPLIAFKVRSQLIWLGLLNLVICLFLPTWPENIVSDLRYTYVAFIPLMIGIFLWFQEKKRTEQIALVALITAVSVIPQLDYYPKLFFLLAGVLFLFLSAPSRN